MKIPDGRDWERRDPAFLTAEEFLACKQLISHSGNPVASHVEEWGRYHPASGKTDIFSLLAPDDVDATISLPESDYDVFTIETTPQRPNEAAETYFSYLGSKVLIPDRWEYLGRFGSDTYNMTLSDSATRHLLCDVIERSFDELQDKPCTYNLLVDLLTGSGAAQSALRDLGFRFGTKENPGPIAFFYSSKIATMCVGFCDDSQVALQARWL